MTRNEFINMLFNNKNGLSLKHIRQIENSLSETFPDGLINDLLKNHGLSQSEATEQALYQARAVFIDMLHDCADMLEIEDFMFEQYRITLTDEEIYTLYYLR